MANLPVDLFLEIADHLTDGALVNLSATNRSLHALLKSEVLKRLKASATEGPGALFWACFGGYSDAVEALLDGGANPNLGFSRPRGFGHNLWAEDSPQPPVMLKKAFKCIATSDGDVYHGSTHYFETCDLIRFYNSYQEFLENLLHGRCRHEYPYPSKSRFWAEYIPCDCALYFPLHLAVFRGHLDVVKRLIEKDLSPSTEWDAELAMLTPLAVAIQFGHAEVAKFILQVETSRLPNVVLSSLCQPMSPLHFATIKGTPEITRQLFEVCGLDIAAVSQVNYEGLPPIWLAYLRGNWEAVSALQDVGANIDHDLANGFTPLQSFPDAHDLIEAIPGRDRVVEEPEVSVHVRLENEKFQGLCGLEIACCALGSPKNMWPGQEEEFYPLFSASLPESRSTDTKTHGNEDPLPEVYAPITCFSLDQKNRGVTAPGIVTFLFQRQGHRYDNDNYKLLYGSDYGHYWLNSKRSEYLARLLHLGADPTATDKFGNNLVELALAQWDFDSCLVIAQYNNKAADTFARHWTLDKFMSYFINSKTRPSVQYWPAICTHGLQAFVSLGLATERSIATRLLLGQLVVTFVREGYMRCPEGEEYLKYFLHLEGLPVGFLENPVDGDTLLHHALESINDLNYRFSEWHTYAMQIILHAGADANRPDWLGVLPIVKAVSRDLRAIIAVRLVWALLDHGARVHLECPPEGAPASMGPRAYEEFNPVVAAIRSARRIDKMEALYKASFPSDDDNNVNNSAPEDLDQEEEPDVNRWEVLKLLLKERPLFRCPRALSAALQARYLEEAFASGNPKVVELLVTYGANPNKRVENGNTALLWAIKMLVDLSFGRLYMKPMYMHDTDIDEIGRLIKHLLHYGADIHTPDRTGQKISTLEYLRELFVVKRKRCWGGEREFVRNRLVAEEILFTEDGDGLAVEGRKMSGRS
ncbi:hypothetical protein B0T22DRAFT_492962 [Podospora appendiculata]|uniref:F-box domain-containing protein n=1 Tax=Podospora appendiculata TaxID=314037 RepID=A0AAE0X6N6_9PEZI|nr:hypothetical protein B0T22DRAFT_492962 [Podospora appendiculata]